ncbi:hypothetical protein KP509_03G085300 [Ceratopteris richardii]|uniref:C2 domain-containing protein n=1 Tax=Ceratopteris richardii TaxID=49495 RepID=A0A8T2VD48_CERRI|nr:hypothetical protein KP509_03G085300 [Ceratopteris richardii]
MDPHADTPKSCGSREEACKAGLVRSGPAESSDLRSSQGGCKDGDGGSIAIEAPVDGYLELTLISAQSLKNAKFFGTMKTYAIIWIDPTCKHRTALSKNSGTSPVWDYFLSIPISSPSPKPLNRPKCTRSASASTRRILSRLISRSKSTVGGGTGERNMTIQIFGQGSVSDVLLGSCDIPLADITRTSVNKVQYLACQLVRPSGRIHGIVNLSVSFKPSEGYKIPPPRNSWAFLKENISEEPQESDCSVSAPDYLDEKYDGGNQSVDESCGRGSVSEGSHSNVEDTHFSDHHNFCDHSNTHHTSGHGVPSHGEQHAVGCAPGVSSSLPPSGVIGGLPQGAGGDAIVGYAIAQALQGGAFS